jgi:hypothetical protein
MSNFFNDTMIGLLQAINIERGNIEMQEVENMPTVTYRATKVTNDKSEDELYISK